MDLPLSGLRIIGISTGCFLVGFALIYFRGARWDRATFLLVLTTGFGLAVVSLVPNSINWIAATLDITKDDRGRIIALLISAVIGLFLLHLGSIGRISKLKRALDVAIRSASLRFDLTDHQIEKTEAKSWDALVIIPAFNEEENIGTLLSQIPSRIGSHRIGVLVVDDGSRDRTAEVAREHGGLVVRNLFNRGQGGASRIGYDTAKYLGVAACVTMDADLQHRPSDLPKLLEPILDGNKDLVIGSRQLGEAERGTAIRSLGIGVLSRLVSVLTGQRLTDVSSGFKAFRTSKLALLDFQEDQFQAAEVLITSLKNGLRVQEVPVSIDRRMHGETKKGTDLNYGVKFVRSLIRAWWAS